MGLKEKKKRSEWGYSQEGGESASRLRAYGGKWLMLRKKSN